MTYQLIVIAGYVGQDAQFEYVPIDGNPNERVALLKFSVAVNKVTGRGADRKETTTWFEVAVWRQLAENLSSYVKKGSFVLVEGEVSVSAYLDKNSSPQASMKISASTVRLLGPKQSQQPTPSSESAPNSPIPKPEDVGELPF